MTNLNIDNKQGSASKKDDEHSTTRDRWVAMLTNPEVLLGELLETQRDWTSSRQWKSIFLLVMLLILGIAAPVLVVVVGICTPTRTVIERYGKLAEKERVESKDQAPSAASVPSTKPIQEELTTNFGVVLHRRLVQITKASPKSLYAIALHYARSGRVEQARHLMHRISPVDKVGFLPGHAWLAYSLITQNRGKSIDHGLVEHHLKVAMNWEGTGPQLRLIYANILETKNEIDEAVKVLQGAINQEPRYVTQLALLANRFQKREIVNRYISDAVALLEQRVEKQPTPLDLQALAEVYLLTDKPDQAMDIIEKGKSIASTAYSWKRMESEVWRYRFRKTVKRDKDGVSLNLAYLDAALAADPTNPTLEKELNNVIAIGSNLTPDMKLFLEACLANGKATALTHIVLGTEAHRLEDFTKARTHFEIADKLTPNSPLIMNNLAYLLMKENPAELSRAETLIDRAISLDKASPWLLKTQAEIRIAQTRYIDAVASLEKALAIQPNDLSIRELLVVAYRGAGLAELADSQLRVLASQQEEAKRPVPKP